MLALVALILAAASPASQETRTPRAVSERTFERLKPSLFTIEVHSGKDGSKSTQGSGYLVSADGRIVTNYHVVGGYVDEPDRYSIRARGAAGEFPLKLLRFDLVNDLAVLEAHGVTATPLRIAARVPGPGSPVVAFGNPGGLGLSLIEGIFNGYAEKGLVERMLLSMPLNSGMSGGPILDTAGEVIGTNVSVMWLSNSLSFGVPAKALAALLDGPPVATDERSLRQELHRQLVDLERDTAERLAREAESIPEGSMVAIGGARSRRLPGVFDCWDRTTDMKDEGITKAQYGCNLQFTPAVEGLGEVASVELLLEHFVSRRSSYGFFGTLEGHALSHNELQPVDPANGVVSAPRCTASRIRVGESAYKANTCVSAYVKHPGLSRFDLLATSLSGARRSTFVSLKMRGFRLDSFLDMTRRLLEGLGETP